MHFFEPGGQGFESLRAHFLSKKFFGRPDHEIGNEQIEPLTDNKMVRLPGAAPGRTSPRQRRRSGAKRRTSGAAASNPSGRANQISLKAPNTRLDRQLRRASYIAIRQLSNVRAAPQVTTLKVLLLPTPNCFTHSPVTSPVARRYQNARIGLVAIDTGGRLRNRTRMLGLSSRVQSSGEPQGCSSSHAATAAAASP